MSGGRLTFDGEHVAELLDLSSQSTSRKTNLTQAVFSSEFWRDDLPPERRALLEHELHSEGGAWSATEADTDPAKVPAGLFLVGDHGIYLMANIPIKDVKSSGISHVCYAREADPNTMDSETLYNAKTAIFGGDDGVEFLPAEFVLNVLNETNAFTICLTEEGIKRDLPDTRQTPSF